MKKILLIIFFIFTTITCCGCSKIDSLMIKSKPSQNYYTENLVNTLSLEKPSSIMVFYKEYFDEFTFPKAESTDIINFVNILNENNFSKKPADLPETYKYKVYLEFSNCKYAITVFNEKYISIYNWDGDYEVDYADISTIPIRLNIYGICKYFTEP